MILITLTMGELVSAFPMSELACVTVRSPGSFMSWHAALLACLLCHQACCSLSCQLSEQACCVRVPQWRLPSATALMFAQLQTALLGGGCQLGHALHCTAAHPIPIQAVLMQAAPCIGETRHVLATWQLQPAGFTQQLHPVAVCMLPPQLQRSACMRPRAFATTGVLVPAAGLVCRHCSQTQLPC